MRDRKRKDGLILMKIMNWCVPHNRFPFAYESSIRILLEHVDRP